MIRSRPTLRQPEAQEFQKLIRWSDPEIGGRRSEFIADKNAHAFPFERLEGILVGDVISEVGSAAVDVGLLEDRPDGVSLIPGGNTEFDAAVKLLELELPTLGYSRKLRQGLAPYILDPGLSQSPPMNGQAAGFLFRSNGETIFLNQLICGHQALQCAFIHWSKLVGTVGLESFQAM
jgi:hypothetical protein